MQITYLSRHLRVITYDPVGNGGSSRSGDPARYGARAVLEDLVAVLDETGTQTCVAVGLSSGGELVTSLAALYPEHVDAVVAISASHAWGVPIDHTDDPRWQMSDPEFWRTDWRGFLEFFFGEACSDPRSTKLWVDTVGWGMETSGEIIGRTKAGPALDPVELRPELDEAPGQTWGFGGARGGS